MEITKRKVGDVAILDLNGKLTIGKGDVVLRETLVEEFDNGGKRVLINLDGVGTIDAARSPRPPAMLRSSCCMSTSRRASC